MDVVSYKTLEQINKETKEKRERHLPLYDGPVINNILKINDESLHEFYGKLNRLHEQSMFSKAEDQFLDDKGAIFNCERLLNETDLEYRERISKQNTSNAKGNKTSLEIIKKEIPEIVDLNFKKYTFGTGSFSVAVMTDDVITPKHILEEVKLKMQESKAYGNKFEVITPELLKVDLGIKVFITKDKSENEKTFIRNKIKEDIRKYINSLNIEENLLKEKIEGIIFENESVRNYEVFAFYINDKEVNFRTQSAEWDERFIENEKIDAIKII